MCNLSKYHTILCITNVNNKALNILIITQQNTNKDNQYPNNFNQVTIYVTVSYLVGLSWSYGSWIYNYRMQSVPITTNVVSSNTAHGEMYSIQLYVIKFVIDLQHVGGFLWVLHFPPPIKLTA